MVSIFFEYRKHHCSIFHAILSSTLAQTHNGSNNDENNAFVTKTFRSLCNVEKLLKKLIILIVIFTFEQSILPFTQIMIDNSNSIVDSLLRDTQNLKASFEFTQYILKDIKDKSQHPSSCIQLVYSELLKTKLQLQDSLQKVDYLEKQTRKSNLHFDRIKNLPMRHEKPRNQKC